MARPRPKTVALVGLGSVIAAGLWLGFDAWRVRSSLEAARAELRTAAPALAAADLRPAREALADADEELANALARSDGPLWSLAHRVPMVGRTTRSVRGIVELADAAVDLGVNGLAEVEPLFADGLDLVDERTGAIEVDTLAQLGGALDAMDVGVLEAAAGRLRDLPTDAVPATVREARAETLDLADRALRAVAGARDGFALAPALLGADGPQRYLLAMQTSGELRGTGGLMGFYAELTVEDGRFVIGRPGVYDALDDIQGDEMLGPIGSLGAGARGEPVDRPEVFAERYDHVAAASFFSNVNVDPDLPTTAPIALRLYQRQTGQQLDGVIAMDPVGLQALMTVVGSFEVAGEAVEGLPSTVEPAELADLVLTDIYGVLGFERSRERKRYLQAVGLGAFQKVFSTSWDGLAMARAVADAAAERHVQVYLRAEEPQRTLRELRVGGAMKPLTPGGDLLAVTANNAVGGKQDVHLGHRFDGEFALSVGADGGGAREGSLRTTIVNPLPSSGMDTYIIGNCLVGTTENQCFEGPPGWNRTWWTIWNPDGAHFSDPTGSDDFTTMWDGGTIHGHRAFDRFVETPPESEGWFATDLQVPITWEREGDDLVYRLTWWHQAKAIPDVLDLTFTVPDGYEVSASLRGGGDGQGMGVLGEGSPAALEVDGQTVRVQGNVTRDLEVEIRLRAPDGEFWEWLGEPLF